MVCESVLPFLTIRSSSFSSSLYLHFKCTEVELHLLIIVIPLSLSLLLFSFLHHSFILSLFLPLRNSTKRMSWFNTGIIKIVCFYLFSIPVSIFSPFLFPTFSLHFTHNDDDDDDDYPPKNMAINPISTGRLICTENIVLKLKIILKNDKKMKKIREHRHHW